MKVLVVGSGGREHAMVWAIARSPQVDKVYCAPGNAGMANLAELVDIKAGDIGGLIRFAKAHGVDVTLVGPEDPLADGIADRFRDEGLAIFGPSAAAARIESSKSFAKDIMVKYGVPTAKARTFTAGGSGMDDALAYIDEVGAPVVVKADGLAAGKGVIVAATVDEAKDAVRSMMEEGRFGGAGDTVLVEEFLEGEEASILAFTDGGAVVPMVSSQDHKRAQDGDEGPNTGGMGAYSPAPVVTPGMMDRIMEEVMVPTVRGMKEEGCQYQGILYAGLMITDEGPRVVEFNCRLGDPETQAVLVRLRSDIMVPVKAVCEGALAGVTLDWDPRPAVCVIMASGGYPGPYEKGKAIEGLDDANAMEGVVVFHAGTATGEGEQGFETSGGRVLGVTALGEDIPAAVERAYEAVDKVYFEKAHFRKDIAHRALARAAKEA
jgi:phosphoribosylamine--glycine ligase